MKLLRHGAEGSEKPGLLAADGTIRDLSGVVDDISGEVLSDAGLARLRALDPATLPVVAADTRLGACVAGTTKFICIGLNYADHAAETGAEIPTEPVVFAKWTSAICGPDDPIEIPRGAQKTDWEVELGVVIGRAGRYIAPEDAAGHIAGYCVINDVSERDWQMNCGGTWDKGKGHDSFGPIGPWLVTPDEIPDPAALGLWLAVDGQRQQDSSTAQMIFSVPRIIAYLSQFMSLQPGDIIATGTPPGVGLGQTPPRFLQGGEVVTLGIDGLGQQCHRVIRA